MKITLASGILNHPLHFSRHTHHITERYSLLTIIVLGESIVSSYSAMVDALHNQMFSRELLFLMIGGLIMMFSMWWMYFDSSIADRLNSRKKAFIWGYGHFFIFISIAAIGASLAAAVDVATDHAEISDQFAGYLVAIPLVVYTTSLWLLHLSEQMSGLQKWIYPLTTMIVLSIPILVPNIGYSVFAISIVFAIRLMFMNKYIT